ncbi:MAG TPA: NnrS family protein, partial [Gallionella sp.]|nr:NnrS family protein [Gallionella sp.]
IEFLRLTLYPQWSVSLSMHVFTFGAMGLIIPAMLIRITRGHTGRPVVFDRRDKRVLWGMMAAFVFRLIAPLFDPADYTRWILLA